MEAAAMESNPIPSDSAADTPPVVDEGLNPLATAARLYMDVRSCNDVDVEHRGSNARATAAEVASVGPPRGEAGPTVVSVQPHRLGSDGHGAGATCSDAGAEGTGEVVDIQESLQGQPLLPFPAPNTSRDSRTDLEAHTAEIWHDSHEIFNMQNDLFPGCVNDMDDASSEAAPGSPLATPRSCRPTPSNTKPAVQVSAAGASTIALGDPMSEVVEDDEDRAPSVVLLHLFILRLWRYEPGLHDMIKADVDRRGLTSSESAVYGLLTGLEISLARIEARMDNKQFFDGRLGRGYGPMPSRIERKLRLVASPAKARVVAKRCCDPCVHTLCCVRYNRYGRVIKRTPTERSALRIGTVMSLVTLLDLVNIAVNYVIVWWLAEQGRDLTAAKIGAYSTVVLMAQFISKSLMMTEAEATPMDRPGMCIYINGAKTNRRQTAILWLSLPELLSFWVGDIPTIAAAHRDSEGVLGAPTEFLLGSLALKMASGLIALLMIMACAGIAMVRHPLDTKKNKKARIMWSTVLVLTAIGVVLQGSTLYFIGALLAEGGRGTLPPEVQIPWTIVSSIALVVTVVWSTLGIINFWDFCPMHRKWWGLMFCRGGCRRALCGSPEHWC